MAESHTCELCNNLASVYCPSDSAFLCSNCDFNVHSANFLVARHIRSSICSLCRRLAGNSFSGAGISPEVTHRPCRNCSPESVSDEEDSISSSTSSCVSTTTEECAVSKRREKVVRRRRRKEKVAAVDYKVEGILVNWCRKMGVEEKKTLKVVPTAVEVMTRWLGEMTVLPFRVCLTASFCVGMRMCEGDTCRDLRRLEQISGVPLKLILATEERIARVIRRGRSREEHVEGSAEC